MDKLDLAVYDTAHKAEGGLAGVAASMSVGQQVLTNKVNYNNEQNKLSLREAVSMMQVTGDTSILEQLAWLFDFRLIPIDAEPEQSLLSAIVNASADHGKVHQTIESAFIDRTVNNREMHQISSEVNDAIDALNALLVTIEVMHENGVKS